MRKDLNRPRIFQTLEALFLQTKMLAVVKAQRQPGAEVRSSKIPDIKPREVLVKVKATSICGTDVHIYRWNAWAQSRVKPPLIIGHEFAGEVIKVGSEVSSLKTGDLISGETHINCGHCFQCRTGNAHICQNMLLRGVDTDGCFAEYHAVPEQSAWKNVESISPEVASAQEPLGNAVHAVFESDVPAKVVAVFGCGPIGVCAVALCRALGATAVIGVDIVPYRLNLAKKMGAHHLLNAQVDDVVKEIMELTEGRGVDVLLEMSGASSAYEQGFRVLRAGGTATLLGLPEGPITLDVARNVVLNNVTVKGIYGRKMFSTWYKTSAILKSGLVDLSKIITHRFRLDEFEKAFELMLSGKSGKVVMIP